ncbi:inositol monophosphatase [bacterium]|nr:inositol monophosphatase [bacterium]
MPLGDTVDRALELARNLALEAGQLLMQRLGTDVGMQLKGEIDPVTEMDRRVEALLVGRLSQEFPDHDFLAEEDTRARGNSPWLWVIDPLDGTTNYAHGYPCFAVSIGLLYEGVTRLGVVYQPATNEMFTAVQGAGGWLGGKRLAVSPQTELGSSFLVTGFPYNIRQSEVLDRCLSRFKRLMAASFAVRRDGSAAYDLACLAAGRFDGYWEEDLKAWDTAAGVLLVREAGGVVKSFSGGEHADGRPGGVIAAGSVALEAALRREIEA